MEGNGVRINTIGTEDTKGWSEQERREKKKRNILFPENYLKGHYILNLLTPNKLSSEYPTKIRERDHLIEKKFKNLTLVHFFIPLPSRFNQALLPVLCAGSMVSSKKGMLKP